MKKYEYVQVCTERFLGASSDEHRQIIDNYAAMGYRYVGFIPVEMSAYGKITEMDLVFEKDL